MCLPLLGRLDVLRPDYRPSQHIASEGLVTPVQSLWGAVLLVDGPFLRGAGGFDERYFLFSEDEDLCRQAHAQGRTVLLVGGARAFHEGGASSSDASLREARRLFAAYQLFEKWDGSRRAGLFRRGIVVAFRLREAAFMVAAFRMVRPGPGAADVRVTLNLFRFMVSRGRAL
jgi:GT2 family glycosyltransferase